MISGISPTKTLIKARFGWLVISGEYHQKPKQFEVVKRQSLPFHYHPTLPAGWIYFGNYFELRIDVIQSVRYSYVCSERNSKPQRTDK